MDLLTSTFDMRLYRTEMLHTKWSWRLPKCPSAKLTSRNLGLKSHHVPKLETVINWLHPAPCLRWPEPLLHPIGWWKILGLRHLSEVEQNHFTGRSICLGNVAVNVCCFFNPHIITSFFQNKSVDIDLKVKSSQHFCIFNCLQKPWAESRQNSHGKKIADAKFHVRAKGWTIHGQPDWCLAKPNHGRSIDLPFPKMPVFSSQLVEKQHPSCCKVNSQTKKWKLRNPRTFSKPINNLYHLPSHLTSHHFSWKRLPKLTF